MFGFKIKVDGGPALVFQSEHNEFALAVMEAFGQFSLPFPWDAEIWEPSNC
ncbi:hypothetical protein [Parasedimentitalea psychrophila]|uniref:Uncharacterized protein n=1 Tax=Parasedimentitalea psychrophila TaxID=2997337 RepID=A0A9Y2P2M1_9RHOB|nr:hypothetical protein [Parasedimentitalea psychrophila]WIY23369.1 hypothetical protein QPJ95_11900 [Parasedimentitalea psychrophila]